MNHRRRRRRRLWQDIKTALLAFLVTLAVLALGIFGFFFVKDRLNREGDNDKTRFAVVNEDGSAVKPREEETEETWAGSFETDPAKSARPKVILLGAPEDEGIRKDNADAIEGLEENGYHVNLDLTETSNVVIIGDSRIVGLSDIVGMASYNATVGAHYRYNQLWAVRKVPMIISLGLENRDVFSDERSGYYAEMVSLVRNSMEKHGSCLIVIAASVNDIDYNEWCSSEANDMMELGNALKEDGTLDDLSPDVFYFGMVPRKGEFETDFQGYSVKVFNEYLAEKVEKSGEGFYIEIGDPLAWEKLYRGDGVHFQDEGSQRIFDLIYTGLQRYCQGNKEDKETK